MRKLKWYKIRESLAKSPWLKKLRSLAREGERMALTNQEKQDCILFLGWPGKTLLSTSTSYSQIVVNHLASLPAEMEPQVRAYLKRLKAIDDRLDSAMCRLSTKEVDNIVLNNDEIDQLRKERKIKIRELSRLLDIPAYGAGNGISVCV